GALKLTLRKESVPLMNICRKESFSNTRILKGLFLILPKSLNKTLEFTMIRPTTPDDTAALI
ncbi:MAG TPA: hypothetical protein DCL61_23840, partial [Cyanobacteria bacterium UBA12227]|nr:hypothetical protein [Cyanobacteria bacterium UBA12227]